MGWYALYKWFKPWRKTSYRNMISWYKRFLYDEWFESLSEDDKQKEIKRIDAIEARRKRDGQEALEHIGQLYSTINRWSGGRMGEYTQILNDMNKFTTHPSKYW